MGHFAALVMTITGQTQGETSCAAQGPLSQPTRSVPWRGPSWLRMLIAFALVALLGSVPALVRAEEVPASPGFFDRSIVLGLTPTHLAIAAVVGAAVGATAAAVVTGNAVAGVGVSTLAAIYIGHLFVEAILVGGFYYFWPDEDQPEDDASPGMTIRGIGAPPSAAPPSPRLARSIATTSVSP